MWKDFSALQRNSNVKLVTSLDISLVFVIKISKHHSSLADQRLINYKYEQCMCKRETYAATLKITVAVMTHFACKSKWQHTQDSLQKIPTPTHLIANIAYRLKPHHTRNQYHRARLDTYLDINVMPTSVYSLVFKDPELKKLAPAIWRLELTLQTQSRW